MRSGFWVSMALVAIIIVVYGSIAVSGRLVVNLSDSNPHKLFWLTPYDGHALKEGETVIWDTATPYLFGGRSFTILKEVGCGAGGILNDVPGGYYCNARFLGKAKTRLEDGRPLNPVHFSGARIPKGYFYAEGHRMRRTFAGRLVDDGFDSRYFGLVESKRVRGVATPVF